jgi:hypothetical protein
MKKFGQVFLAFVQLKLGATNPNGKVDEKLMSSLGL